MASLEDTGRELGKVSGDVKLSELNNTGSGQSASPDTTTGHAYDRNYTSNTAHYLRTNPFAVEQGHAADPSGSAAPWHLSNWHNYDQWDAGVARGSNFDITATAETTMTFAFTPATGYTRDTNSLNQRLYYKECATSECVDGSSNVWNPRTASGKVIQDGPSDASTYTLSGLDSNTYYIFAIATRHNQDGTGNAGIEQESEPYEKKGSLTQFGFGISQTSYAESGDNGHYLWNTTLRPCVGYTVGFGTESWGCGEDDDPNTCSSYLGQNITVYTRQPLNTNAYLFMNSDCATNPVNGSAAGKQSSGANWPYIAINTDSDPPYIRSLNSSGRILATPNDRCCA